MRVLITSEWSGASLSSVVAESGVTDVVVVAVNPKRPLGERERSRLSEPAIVAAICVDLSEKAVEAISDFFSQRGIGLPRGHSWHRDELVIRSWLVGQETAPTVARRPSEVVQTAVAAEPRLLLAESALLSADKLAEATYPWVSAAVDALRGYAAAEGKVGNAFQYFRRHRPDIDFATSGKVKWDYEVTTASQTYRRNTQRHLLLDVRIWRPPVEVPRIYFDLFRHADEAFTLILLCGPHPPEPSTQRAKVHLPQRNVPP